jgi:hypothetical protein
MKLEGIIYLLVLILGITVAIAPWTFAPVCMSKTTRSMPVHRILFLMSSTQSFVRRLPK